MSSMTELPDWAPARSASSRRGAGAPHAIPVSTGVRAGPRRVLIALALRRESLARLREEPRCALTIMGAGNIALTVARARRSSRTRWRSPTRSRPSASTSRRSRTTPSRASRSSPAWRGAGPSYERARARRRRTRGAGRAGAPVACPAMKLASFRAPGGDQQYGEVLDGRVVAFDDGSTVHDRLALGRPRARRRRRARRSRRSSCSRPHVPRAIFGIGLNYRDHAAETGKEPPARADRLHEAPELGRRAGRRRARAPRDRPAPGLRGRAGGRHRPRRRGGRLRDGRRPQRARPPGPRAAVDAREGLRRRRARSARGSRPPTRCPTPARCACARGSTASRARTAAPPT